MASLRTEAQDVLQTARDGIGWIICWKNGRSWNCYDVYPEDYDDSTSVFTFDQYTVRLLQEVLQDDKNAILVNGWFQNLGDCECMTRDSLAAALRWQYDLGHYTVADALENCEQVA